jgi:hypothetical protein
MFGFSELKAMPAAGELAGSGLDGVSPSSMELNRRRIRA